VNGNNPVRTLTFYFNTSSFRSLLFVNCNLRAVF